jgi:hypothetical protein
VCDIRHEFWVGAVFQIDWRHLEPIRIVPAVFVPQSHTSGAGEWFFVARWHLQDLHFVSLGGSLTPQFQQYLASGRLRD